MGSLCDEVFSEFYQLDPRRAKGTRSGNKEISQHV